MVLLYCQKHSHTKIDGTTFCTWNQTPHRCLVPAFTSAQSSEQGTDANDISGCIFSFLPGKSF